MAGFTFAIAVTGMTWAMPALAQDCPPAGARYEHDNFVVRSIVTSLGGRRHPALGCQWRRSTDNRVIWLEPGVAMKPVGDSSTVAPRIPPARPAVARPPARVAVTSPGIAAPSRPVPAPAPAPVRPAGDFGPIQIGVYECDQPISIGGMIMGSPVPGPMFGVTGPGAYRDFNGGTGSFSFSGGILTMTSGPLRGTRYQRSDATLFHPLDAKGQRGSIRCVLNKRKDLRGRW